MSGKLYLVTTPIGNLEDITLRALRVLKEVDVIAAEDTRHSRQLLSHFDIHSELVSYHAFNEHDKTDALLKRIENGENIALVTDAGTPSVADPGFFLVRAAQERDLDIAVIPGVSAVTFAVTASGLPVDKFAFFGFVPVKSGRKSTFFADIKEKNMTSFVFESPFRVGKTLDFIREFFGDEVQIAIIREATKIHEEVIKGTAGEVCEKCRNRAWKGEFVIGIAPQHAESCANDKDMD
ncbi:MAG: 16S rRNA (cytidine(1402)-2'-O)-methyltransferase [Lentisphaeria bacterium]|nr:16S rRNA (cytidine(1402)-2'-O)-methyltransferase [Lentisphaeria bacterium]